jgi:urease accessory protein
MLQLIRILDRSVQKTDDSLTLPHMLRERSRQRVRLLSGAEAGLFLPRGTVLRHGDVLEAEDGTTVRVLAMDEHLSVVRFPDKGAMARACFHLGNRHVPLQIDEDSVAYGYDPVVDDMVRAMGFEVEERVAPFHPEPGAYHMPTIRLACEPTLVGGRS